MGWFDYSECILKILFKMLVSLVKIIQLKSWSSFLCLTADQILCRQKKVSFEEKYIMSLTSVLCCFLSTNWKLLKIQRKSEISLLFIKLSWKSFYFLFFPFDCVKFATFYIFLIFSLVVVGIQIMKI